LAAAIEQGVSLAKTYKAGAEITFPGADNGADYTVHNYEGGSFGDTLSLLEATVFSVNVVYAQVIKEIGPENVAQVATDMGITTPLCTTCLSTALGSNEVNPLDMASAYGTFAASGTRHPPYGITKIVDADGKALYDAEDDPTLEASDAIAPAVAYLTTTALEQVIQRGTGVNAKLDRPAAGKTGTAQEYRDAWFAGYTPDLAAAVWVGYPEGQIEMKPSCSGLSPCKPTRTVSGSGVTGGSWPAMIWQRFMLRALSGVPADAFDIPSVGFVTRVIDTRKGNCLAGNFTPDEFKATATFAQGTAPKQECRFDSRGKEVPDVFGFPIDDARDIIEGEGFVVETIQEYSATYPPGTVIGQDPGGDDRAPAGSTILLVVSTTDRSDQGQDGNRDTATVPDVLGLPESDARERLEGSGFHVEIIHEAESSKGHAKNHRGEVWKQSPGGGTEAERGSTVTIWVNP
jgi:penicillin-binding protein 1A